jgi:hypothetical protein
MAANSGDLRAKLPVCHANSFLDRFRPKKAVTNQQAKIVPSKPTAELLNLRSFFKEISTTFL